MDGVRGRCLAALAPLELARLEWESRAGVTEERE